MENKRIKKTSATKNSPKSVRLSSETIKKAAPLLELANRGLEIDNKKQKKRKVKIDQIIRLGLELVTESHIKDLLRRSLKNSDRQDILRKKYSEIHGQVTMEEFIGITMTPAYFEFLKEHGHVISAA
ncbi:MAG: hypothetical protein HUU57_02790 [Bdellovibrio sp.]|nr:hypothetical protein [Bdellovibrio sp.]